MPISSTTGRLASIFTCLPYDTLVGGQIGSTSYYGFSGVFHTRARVYPPAFPCAAIRVPPLCRCRVRRVGHYRRTEKPGGKYPAQGTGMHFQVQVREAWFQRYSLGVCYSWGARTFCEAFSPLSLSREELYSSIRHPKTTFEK